MPMVEISNGEVVDRWTILRIKKARITNSSALINIDCELDLISPLREKIVGRNFPNQIAPLELELFRINKDLWNVEDQLRELEKLSDFGETFISLARSVYKLNDERSRIKRKINDITMSTIIEEKSYEQYT